METKEFPGVYPYSLTEAKRLNEAKLWKASHADNVACRKAIEAAILLEYDGTRLSKNCAEGVIAEFGYHRTAFVLANSLEKKKEDGRVSRGSRDWAKGFYIPDDGGHNAAYAVANDTGTLDVFVNQFRREYQKLGLFDYTHCLPDTSKQDFEGKVIVLKADGIKESCLTPQSQLWLCTGGFGSRHDSSGRAVFATCLADGESARLNRQDFAGVLAEANLPEWAMEKLEQLQGPKQTADDSPEMGGMTMQ